MISGCERRSKIVWMSSSLCSFDRPSKSTFDGSAERYKSLGRKFGSDVDGRLSATSRRLARSGTEINGGGRIGTCIGGTGPENLKVIMR
jgi:hypothetical protein